MWNLLAKRNPHGDGEHTGLADQTTGDVNAKWSEEVESYTTLRLPSSVPKKQIYTEAGTVCASPSACDSLERK